MDFDPRAGRALAGGRFAIARWDVPSVSARIKPRCRAAKLAWTSSTVRGASMASRRRLARRRRLTKRLGRWSVQVHGHYHIVRNLSIYVLEVRKFKIMLVKIV